ncbi:adenylyltransferase/cytidyltransferase family protein [Candidatus Woesearchaeota archaeon]|nr:adenylyltransferase/cytidyltransferase family protein [Candidatus Woesearchaeota archaeon]
MKKVMVFGSFDGIHPGHLFFLRKAKAFGDFLVVVIGRDENIKKIKNKLPRKNEKQRLKDISLLKMVDDAVLGGLNDYYEIIAEKKPDIICLGHDQMSVGELRNELEKRKLNSELHVIGAYMRHIYRSSKIRKFKKMI